MPWDSGEEDTVMNNDDFDNDVRDHMNTAAKMAYATLLMGGVIVLSLLAGVGFVAVKVLQHFGIL